MNNTAIKFGDIFLVDFGEDSIGHEYKKRRPAVVIQSAKQIQRSNLITVLPISSKLNKGLEEDILIQKDENNLLLENSLIKVHHIMSFDYQRIYYKIGEVGENISQKIKDYLKIHFDLL